MDVSVFKTAQIRGLVIKIPNVGMAISTLSQQTNFHIVTKDEVLRERSVLKEGIHVRDKVNSDIVATSGLRSVSIRVYVHVLLKNSIYYIRDVNIADKRDYGGSCGAFDVFRPLDINVFRVCLLKDTIIKSTQGIKNTPIENFRNCKGKKNKMTESPKILKSMGHITVLLDLT